MRILDGTIGIRVIDVISFFALFPSGMKFLNLLRGDESTMSNFATSHFITGNPCMDCGGFDTEHLGYLGWRIRDLLGDIVVVHHIIFPHNT